MFNKLRNASTARSLFQFLFCASFGERLLTALTTLQSIEAIYTIANVCGLLSDFSPIVCISSARRNNKSLGHRRTRRRGEQYRVADVYFWKLKAHIVFEQIDNCDVACAHETRISGSIWIFFRFVSLFAGGMVLCAMNEWVKVSMARYHVC